MTECKLNADTTFAIEASDSILRLIVLKNNQEMACRKITKNGLKSYLFAQDNSIFKGRLQLHKFNNMVTITVKGEPVGMLSVTNFENLIPS